MACPSREPDRTAALDWSHPFRLVWLSGLPPGHAPQPAIPGLSRTGLAQCWQSRRFDKQHRWTTASAATGGTRAGASRRRRSGWAGSLVLRSGCVLPGQCPGRQDTPAADGTGPPYR